MLKQTFLRTLGRKRIPIHKLSQWIKFSNWLADQKSEGQSADRYAMYQAVCDRLQIADVCISYLEFGVYRGDSIRWWSKNLTSPLSRLTGFDTFTGLPQEWNDRAGAGYFSTDGAVPAIDDARVSFERGLFQNTLPGFLREFARPGKLILHMDADLYSSTIFALMQCGPLLKAGDLILFDEFACPEHEFRAFADFLSAFPFAYEVVGHTDGFNQCCMLLS